jgi:hypothetical protein
MFAHSPSKLFFGDKSLENDDIRRERSEYIRLKGGRVQQNLMSSNAAHTHVNHDSLSNSSGILVITFHSFSLEPMGAKRGIGIRRECDVPSSSHERSKDT